MRTVVQARVLVAVALLASIASATGAQQGRAVILRRPVLDSLLRTAPSRSIAHVNTAGVSKAVTTQTDSVTLKPGDAIVRETGAKATMHTVTQNQKPVVHYDLPATIYAATADSRIVGFSVIVDAQTLAFDAAHTSFAGDILIGLEDSLHRSERDNLARPVDVQIISENAAMVPGRHSLQLTHTNVPYEAVPISGSVTGVDTIFLNVQPSFGSAQRIGVVLGRPKLNIAAPTAIAAYGLEKAHVTVSAAPTDISAKRQVTLSARRSQPTVMTLSVSPDNLAATTDLPSGSPGDDMIEVQGEPFAHATWPISYYFPTWFIAFAILGGAAGAAIKVLSETDKSVVLGRPLVLGLIAGILTGLVVAVGAAIGVNLTPVALPHQFSEGLGFVVAAIGAILGIQLSKPKEPVT